MDDYKLKNRIALQLADWMKECVYSMINTENKIFEIYDTSKNLADKVSTPEALGLMQLAIKHRVSPIMSEEEFFALFEKCCDAEPAPVSLVAFGALKL